MNKTKEELLIECITQFEYIDKINKNEQRATTTSLIREIRQVLNLPVVGNCKIYETSMCQHRTSKEGKSVCKISDDNCVYYY